MTLSDRKEFLISAAQLLSPVLLLGLGQELCLCGGHRMGYWFLLSGFFNGGVCVALIPVVLPAWCRTDAVAEPSTMIRGSARRSTEAMWLVALAQECLSVQGSLEKKALWGDWARLWWSSHEPYTESYSGNRCLFYWVPWLLLLS